MAAVLYEVENGKADTTFKKDLINEKRAKEKELKETVDIIPIEDLKNILLEIAYEDVNLQNLILTKYSPVTPRHMVRLKKQVNDIGYKYSGRDDFVDYYHVSEYIDELYKLLMDNVPMLIERRYRIEAFELVNCVFYEVGNRDIDDSDGGTEIIARECYEYWKNILEVCDKQEKNELFRWFKEHKENYVNEEMCNACSRNRYKDLIKYLKKISRYPDGQRLAQEISDSWKREYKKRSAMIDELNRAGF